MPKSIELTQIKCIDKAMQKDYVDQVVIYLQPFVQSLDENGEAVEEAAAPPVTVVVGAPQPMGFRKNTQYRFSDNTAALSINGGPPQQWEQDITTTVQVPDDGQYTLKVSVINARDLADPYKVAKVLFAIGSLAAAAAAGYGVGKALSAIFAAEAANDIFNTVKDVAKSGAGGLVSLGLEELAGLITDIFRDWPQCGGPVLSDSLSFDSAGQKVLNTSPTLTLPKGCGKPDYSLQFVVRDEPLFPGPEPHPTCVFRFQGDVNLYTYEPWWRHSLGGSGFTRYSVYDVARQSIYASEDTPIFVSIEPGRNGGLDLSVSENTPQGGVAFDRVFRGVTPQMVGIRTRPSAVLQPAPADNGERKPLALTLQEDTTQIQLPHGVTPWWLSPLLPVINPDRIISRITLPEIDVEMDLYKEVCTNAQGTVVDQSAIFYRRGGTTARQAQGRPGFTVSTATLLPAPTAVK